MKKIIIALLCAAAPAIVHAEQWQVLGTRPMGMGGAFVAVAQGPIAQYWNPAGLYASTGNVSGMEIPVAAGIEFTGKTMENASKLGEMAKDYSAIQSKQTGGGAMDAQQMAAFVKSLPLIASMNEKGTGALVEANGGLNFKFAKVTVSVNNYTSLGASPFVDVKNIGLNKIGGAGGIFDTGTGLDNTSTSFSAEESAAATTIATAINAIGYASVQNLICGSGATCLSLQTGGKIASASDLANVLINQAKTNGLTGEQILDAANKLSENASAAKPVIDAIGAGGAFAENTTNLTIKGGSFTEIAFGLARPLPIDGLTAGGNVKLINGRMAYAKISVLESQSGVTAPFTDVGDTMKASWAPAIDLGLMYDINKLAPKFPMKPRAGLVVRNLNRPSFKNPDAQGGSSHLDTQVRMGFAIKPANFWNVALDMDLTTNLTPVKGYKSRQLALGTELNLINRKAFNIPLRAGIMKNMANTDSKMAYTLGTGLNLLFMHIDVAGVVSSNRVKIEDKNIPTRAEFAASFGLLF